MNEAVLKNELERLQQENSIFGKKPDHKQDAGPLHTAAKIGRG